MLEAALDVDSFERNLPPLALAWWIGFGSEANVTPSEQLHHCEAAVTTQAAGPGGNGASFPLATNYIRHRVTQTNRY